VKKRAKKIKDLNAGKIRASRIASLIDENGVLKGV